MNSKSIEEAQEQKPAETDKAIETLLNERKEHLINCLVDCVKRLAKEPTDEEMIEMPRPIGDFILGQKPN